MKVIKGNLLDLADQGKFDVIIHGCNCFHAMSGGIARQIAERYPEVEAADNLTEKGAKWKLGTTDNVVVRRPFKLLGIPILGLTRSFIVINAYTQYNPGADFNYEAIKDCFEYIKLTAKGLNMRIAYPMIGAGIAGGDWNVISKIIDQELEGEDHTLVVWDGK